MRHIIHRAFVALSLTACSAVYAVTTVPFVFTQGTPAKAAEVNADFQALATAIDTLTARVDKLDGTTPVTAADLVGDYSVEIIYTELLTRADASSKVASYSVQGTITLASNGTALLSSTEYQREQNMGPGYIGVVTSDRSPLTNTATLAWSLAGGRLNIGTLTGGLSVLSGGRLLVGATRNNAGDMLLIQLIKK